MKYLIITTINPPETGSIAKLRAVLDGWHIVVVGDRKTPKNWAVPGVRYLSVEEQSDLFPKFSAALPFNSYARKNIGYLYAIKNGATIIAETDDDNFAYEGYLQNLDKKVTGLKMPGTGWVNAYACFTEQWIWPRGFSLRRLLDNNKVPLALPEQRVSEDVAIQQFLADGDSDVDAIFRLTSNENVTFRKDLAVFLEPGQTCPFNSQNTVWMPEAFPLLYLPAHVSFRMTDIWRSFVATRCTHAAGQRIAFLSPTVFQTRNEHDLLADFKQEIDGYLYNELIVQHLSELELPADPAMHLQNMVRCYEAIHTRMGLISPAEMELINLWAAELAA